MRKRDRRRTAGTTRIKVLEITRNAVICMRSKRLALSRIRAMTPVRAGSQVSGEPWLG